MRTVENALTGLESVSKSRVNLSRKWVDVEWSGDTPPGLIETIEASGHQAHLSRDDDNIKSEGNSKLLKATAVAGFASSNIMMMSVAVWSGAEADMRLLFHWISAVIAFPTLLYSGRVFFQSAWMALKHRKTNMDVPISVGVCLAFALSLYDTVTGHHAVYFDASVMLLFFLLIGRTLDQWVRNKASDTASAMAKLLPVGVNVIEGKKSVYRSLCDVAVGDTIEVLNGERISLDGQVEAGISSVDTSMVNGESIPAGVQTGNLVLSGMLNLERRLLVRVRATQEDSFLSKTIKSMERASSSRSSYLPLADRMVLYYSPVVHLTALLTFIGWIFYSGDFHQSISAAIAVLIITCPCALALAVPMVQVIAMRRLFKSGILTHDGAALERMNEIDTVIFDKTGTLTFGVPSLVNGNDTSPDVFLIARAIAAHSTHPFSRAIFKYESNPDDAIEIPIVDVTEYPGKGLEAQYLGDTYHLGSTKWLFADTSDAKIDDTSSSVILTKNGELQAQFDFEDLPLPGAAEQVKRLIDTGLNVQLLSGDIKSSVQKTANLIGITNFKAECSPDEKLRIVEDFQEQDHRLLMIGDGLNDVPALSVAHASMAPASGADAGRSAADFLMLDAEKLPVMETMEISRKANMYIRQNFKMAILYNFLALPIAILGFATPLIAAIAMSTSSILVVLNSARLMWRKQP